MSPMSAPVRRVALVTVALALLAACGEGTAAPTPPIVPGGSAAPRAVNLIARDYAFTPTIVDLVPGETITLRLVNGGLEVHEAIIGPMAAQDAWEAAEAATVGHPPGPTPAVSVPPEVAGLRVVAESGKRTDATWTVPEPVAGETWLVGCHIPGHWAKGMVVPVRFVAGG